MRAYLSSCKLSILHCGEPKLMTTDSMISSYRAHRSDEHRYKILNPRINRGFIILHILIINIITCEFVGTTTEL